MTIKPLLKNELLVNVKRIKNGSSPKDVLDF